MRVQPHLPSRPFTATVIESCGAALCACSAANRPAPPEPRIRMSVSRVFGTIGWRARPRPGPDLPYAQTLQCFGAARFRLRIHARVQAFAVAVHCNEQGAESVDAELPQRLGIEVIEVHVLDRFDPGGLERRRAADDGEVDAA